MKYATWKLVFSGDYGIGPESDIAKLGGRAEAAYSNGDVTLGGVVLGYVTGDFDSELLTAWEYTELSALEALAFVQELHTNPRIDDGGRIVLDLQGE